MDELKIKSKIIIFYLILCLICSFTAVSAVDINETTNQASTGTLMAANIDDNSTGGTLNSNGNEVLAAGNSASGSVLGASGETGSFTDLDTLIKLSSGNLVLYQNYAYDSNVDTKYSKDGIVLTKTIHINGNGYSIDGSNLVNVFTVDVDDVVLDNLYLVNTNGDDNFNGASSEYVFKVNKADTAVTVSAGDVIFNDDVDKNYSSLIEFHVLEICS